MNKKTRIILLISVIGSVVILALSACLLIVRKENVKKAPDTSVPVPVKNEDIAADESSAINSTESFVAASDSSQKNQTPSNTEASSAAPESVNNSSSEEFEPVEKVTQIFKITEKDPFVFPEMQYGSFYDDASGSILPYRLFIPDNYDASKKYPVFFYLHGAGERGNDNSRHIEYLTKSFHTAGDILDDSIILAPQCPYNGWWNIDLNYGDEKGLLGAAMRLLFDIESKYSCDTNRIYVSGLSMGGYATWSVLERYSDVFAAGVPICGWGDSSKGSVLAKIPIWIYHGDADNTVSHYCSQEMYNAIKSAGGSMVHFTTLNGVGHNAWDYALSDRDMFCWMFAQNKNKSKSGDDSYEYIPYLKVVSPDNNTVFTHNDIKSFGSYYSGNSTYVTAYLSDDAYERLKIAYKSNIGKEFTVYYLSEMLYKFKPSGEPQEDEFIFADCVNPDMIDILKY